MRGSVLACHVSWMDPINDGGMVHQSVANWTAAMVHTSMWHDDRNGWNQHGSQGVRNHSQNQTMTVTMGVDAPSQHESFSIALVKLV